MIVSNNANSASGLLAAMQLTLSDGSTAAMMSGGTGSWRSTSSIPQNFAAPNLDDSGWSTPVILSMNGASQPWGPITVPSSLTDISLSPSQGTSAPTSTAKLNSPSSTTTSGSIKNSGTTTTTALTPATTAGSDGSSGSPSGGSIASVGGSKGAPLSSGSSGIGSNKSSGAASATESIVSNATHITASGAVSTASSSGGTTAANLPASAASGSHVPVAAIAGGVVGGVVLILLLFLIWFFCRRKSQDSPAASGPPTIEVRDSESLLSPTRPRPFTTLVAPGHNRTGSGSSDSASRTTLRKGLGGFGYQDVPAAPASVTSNGSRAEDLGATLAKLQELTAELNRGLADHGGNTHRIALTVSTPQEVEGEETSHWNGPLPPPYIEERRRRS
ncbi:hypothetical protein C0991_011250 [Blastosporella zonata]|nr:hypothetical protein C0991_011250 [Blastosporella zonata]